MKLNRQLAWVALGFYLSGCTGVMTKNQAAMVGAATCGLMGGGRRGRRGAQRYKRKTSQ